MTITYNCDKCKEQCYNEGNVKTIDHSGHQILGTGKDKFELCEGCMHGLKVYLTKQPTDVEVRSYLEFKEKRDTSRYRSIGGWGHMPPISSEY